MSSSQIEVAIRLTPDMVREVDRLAADELRSRASWVRVAVVEKLARERNARLHRQLAGAPEVDRVLEASRP